MRRNFWSEAFNVSIIASIIFKAFQLLDRICNIVVLNLEFNKPGSYGGYLNFMNLEIRKEKLFFYIIYLSHVIIFSIWLFVKYKQAYALANRRLTYKPIWALFSFIIPIFNLVAPFKIMNDLWTVFNKDMSKEIEGKNLIKQWWFLSIGLFIFQRFLSTKFQRVNNLHEFLTEEFYYLALYAVSLHYYLLLRRIVNNINK